MSEIKHAKHFKTMLDHTPVNNNYLTSGSEQEPKKAIVPLLDLLNCRNSPLHL